MNTRPTNWSASGCDGTPTASWWDRRTPSSRLPRPPRCRSIGWDCSRPSARVPEFASPPSRAANSRISTRDSPVSAGLSPTYFRCSLRLSALIARISCGDLVCGQIFWQGDRHHLPGSGPKAGTDAQRRSSHKWFLSPSLRQKIWLHTKARNS